MASATMEPIRTQSAQDLGPVELIAVDEIARSPLNPRKRFDDDKLQELAASIEQHGVQTPIHVRPADPDNWHICEGEANGAPAWFLSDNRLIPPGNAILFPDRPDVRIFARKDSALIAQPLWEIVAGERRWRAARLAGLTHIPAFVRNDMTDAMHLELAIIENMQREDIDAIEQARAYLQLRELGNTVEKVAQKVGISVSAVSNATRLLALPDAVLDQVSSGKLGTSHARALLRFEQFPVVVTAMAESVVRRGLTSREMEKAIPHYIWDDLEQAKLIVGVRNNSYERPCRNCPFGAYVGETYYGRCLKPEHHEELLQEAEKAAEVEAQKQQEALLKRAAKDANLRNKLIAANKSDSPAVTGQKVLRLSNLKYDQYERCGSDYNQVDGCTASCPCRGAAMDGSGNLVDICLDVGRRKSLKGKATKERKVRVKAIGVANLQTWNSPALHTDQKTVMRVIAMLAWNYLRNLNMDVKRAAVKNMPGGDLHQLLISSGYGMKDQDAWCTLAAQNPAQLLALLGELRIREELRGNLENHGEKTPVADFLLNNPVPEPAPLEKYKDCPECKGLMRLKQSADGEAAAYMCGCGHKEWAGLEEGTAQPVAETHAPEQPETCSECGTALVRDTLKGTAIWRCPACTTFKWVETDTHDSAGIPKPRVEEAVPA